MYQLCIKVFFSAKGLLGPFIRVFRLARSDEWQPNHTRRRRTTKIKCKKWNARCVQFTRERTVRAKPEWAKDNVSPLVRWNTKKADSSLELHRISYISKWRMCIQIACLRSRLRILKNNMRNVCTPRSHRPLSHTLPFGQNIRHSVQKKRQDHDGEARAEKTFIAKRSTHKWPWMDEIHIQYIYTYAIGRKPPGYASTHTHHT